MIEREEIKIQTTLTCNLIMSWFPYPDIRVACLVCDLEQLIKILNGPFIEFSCLQKKHKQTNVMRINLINF